VDRLKAKVISPISSVEERGRGGAREREKEKEI